MNLDEQLANIEQRSEYTRDVLGKMPAWILRWGSSIILIVLVLMISLSWIIKYPDIIPAPTILITELPPLRVVARSSGDLHILKPRTEQVSAGEVIAVISNSVDYKRLHLAKQWLIQYEQTNDKHDFAFANLIPMGVDLQELGELQVHFSRFLTQLNAYHLTVANQTLDRRLQALKTEKFKRTQLLSEQKAQLQALLHSLEIARTGLDRLTALAVKKLIPAAQLDEQRRQLFAAVNTEKQQRSLIANTEVELSRLEKEALEVELLYKERTQKDKLQLEGAYHELKGEISLWEQKYLLTAPIKGKISWANYWSTHQSVKLGEIVFTVVPEQEQKIFARISLPMKNFGKAAVGQAVFIKLESFPYQEFGIVSGTIVNIAPAPESAHYDVRVKLPKGLTSSFGKTLPFKHEMLGHAEIVTEDLRLIERIFYQLVSAMHNHT